jgi:flagellin FlaB
MIKKLMGLMNHNQKGITGLETAIILIAFVVVAAVFAYTVLSAGLFSTQKSQEAVYNALGEASSTLELRGSVVAYNSTLNTDNSIGKVEVTVSSNGTGKIDLTTLNAFDGSDLTVDTSSNRLQISFNDLAVSIPQCVWTVAFIGANNSDDILDPGEKAVITIWLHDFAEDAWAAGANPPFLAANNVDTYHTFRIEIKPSTGASLSIERTTPALLTDVVDLH